MYTLRQSSDRIWYSFNRSFTLSVSHQTVSGTASTGATHSVSHQTVSGTASTGAAHSLTVIRPYQVQVQLELHTLCQSSDRIWYSFNWSCTLSVSHQTVSGTASTGAAHSLTVIRPYQVQVQLELHTLCQSSDRIWYSFNWSCTLCQSSDLIWYSFNWRCTLSVSHQTVSGTASTGDANSLSVIRPYLVQLQLEIYTL